MNLDSLTPRQRQLCDEVRRDWYVMTEAERARARAFLSDEEFRFLQAAIIVSDLQRPVKFTPRARLKDAIKGMDICRT